MVETPLVNPSRRLAEYKADRAKTIPSDSAAVREIATTLQLLSLMANPIARSA